MLGLLALMMVVIVTGITHALHPPSNVETIDPVTVHLQGEFVESNLGTALELDGLTVRLIAQQYSCAGLRQWLPARRSNFASPVPTWSTGS